MCTGLEQWILKEFEKGWEIGVKRGLEKDKKIGIVQRDRELILRWTAAGYQTAVIADLLGLSEEKVRILQTGANNPLGTSGIIIRKVKNG